MRALACLAVLTSASIARADPDAAAPDFDRAFHGQLEPGMRAGSVALDGQTVGGTGGVLVGGVRYGHVMLVADLEQLGVHWTSPAASPRPPASGIPATASGGTETRVGAAARYYLARGVEEKFLLGEAWVSAGVGREAFAWNAGGKLTRGDVMVGVGGTFGMHGPRWRAGERRWWGGMTIAVYVRYAERTDTPLPAACGGPCDAPTPPSRFDRAVLVDATLPFGK